MEATAQLAAEKLARLHAITSITKDNARDHSPPKLRDYQGAASRGPASLPAVWYEKLQGTTWSAAASQQQKPDWKVFDNAVKKWRGWTGGNELRATQRRTSYQQSQACSHGRTLSALSPRLRDDARARSVRAFAPRVRRTTSTSASAASAKRRRLIEEDRQRRAKALHRSWPA